MISNHENLTVTYFSDIKHSMFKSLREEYHLNKLVELARNDIESITLLTSWVNSRWEHDGSNVPKSFSPLDILREAASGVSFRCVEYSIVLSSVLCAIGMPARCLSLMTSDVEVREVGAGHVVCEAFSRSANKWIFIDPQFNIIPLVEGYAVNAIEFRDAIKHKKNIEFLQKSEVNSAEYCEFIKQYLYFITVNIDNSLRDEKQLPAVRWGPPGSKEPKIFQIKYPMKPARFTHEVEDLYPEKIIFLP